MAQSQGDYTKLCQLRELFHGRFTDQESATLLEVQNGDLQAAAALVLASEPQELRQLLETEQNKWRVVESARSKVRQKRSVLEEARAGTINTEARQFACAPCDSYWWRRTPQRKQVSKCKRCKTRYDPVPRDREWGWAEFKCPALNCGHEFGGWCAMYMTSPCFKCGTRCYPVRIVPPNERKPRSTPSQHACNAWDCAGNRGRNLVLPPPGSPEYEHRCVHPVSRRANGLPIVVQPSVVHDSTGSTVDTFLPQTDMELPKENFFLPSIPEERLQ